MSKDLECNAPTDPEVYKKINGDVLCKCVICPHCGGHSADNKQGHFWSYCQRRQKIENLHFCCPEKCELDSI